MLGLKLSHVSKRGTTGGYGGYLLRLLASHSSFMGSFVESQGHMAGPEK